jgi:hypothetical protein
MSDLDRFKDLCSQTTHERDPEKLRALGREINEALNRLGGKVIFEATDPAHRTPNKKAA